MRPTRKPTRLTTHDYSAPGYYFVTICTADKANLFGTIPCADSALAPSAVRLSEMGKLVAQTIEHLPLRFPRVLVDKYVVMPNHVHLILVFQSVPVVENDAVVGAIHESPLPPQASEPSVQNISSRPRSLYSQVIGYLKATASREIHRQIAPDIKIWQRDSFDHIIRTEEQYQRIWHYIDTNPAKWLEDVYYRGT